MPYNVKQNVARCKGWAVVNDNGELKDATQANQSGSTSKSPICSHCKRRKI